MDQFLVRRSISDCDGEISRTAHLDKNGNKDCHAAIPAPHSKVTANNDSLSQIPTKSETGTNFKVKMKSKSYATSKVEVTSSNTLVSEFGRKLEETAASKIKSEISIISNLETALRNNSLLKINKILTSKTKLEILKRDQCCQYTDQNTYKKCGSTYKLEIDHKKPKWANGDHHENNLQVLCKNHNNFKYKTESGLK